MRLDYTLYTVAIIFFIITGIAIAYATEQLWTITTTVLGILFIGLGYMLRPRPTAKVAETPSIPAPTQAPTAPLTKEVVVEEKPVVEAPPPKVGLTEVKGIGEKRAQQLQALGINSVEELAKASAKDLARKLKVSPKITERWIESAKRLVEKS